jgi:hypothetical protein
LLSDSINTIKDNPETLLRTSRNVGLNTNANKTKYMIISPHQNSGQIQNIRIDIESFEKVAKFKNFETALTSKNYLHDDIKSRLNSGNVFYNSVQNFCLRVSYQKG